MDPALNALCEQVVPDGDIDSFGEDHWVEPAEVLLADYADSRRLDPVGRRLALAEVTRLLSQRHYLACQPSAAAAVPAVIITGLPRSGSTFLQALLAGEPCLRTPTLEESLDPDGHCRSSHDAERLAAARATAAAYIGLIDRRAPQLRARHHMAVGFPEECITLMQLSFASHKFELMADVPGYSQWFAGADLTPAYRQHFAVLGQLTGLTDRSRWVLKAPAHALHPDALFHNAPGTLYVQTHRDPTSAIASYAALLTESRRVLGSPCDQRGLYRWLGERWANGLARLDASPVRRSGRVLDVAFRHLVESPGAVVGQIMRCLGHQLTGDGARVAATASAVSLRTRTPTNLQARPTFADDPVVAEAFTGYRDRYRDLL